MAKDYAKYIMRPRRGLVEQGWRLRLLLVVTVIMLLLLGGGGLYFYHTKPQLFTVKALKGQIAQWRARFSHQPAAEGDTASLQGATTATAAPTVHFSFYTTLPNSDQAPPPEVVAAAAQHAAAKEQASNSPAVGGYSVQIGEFDDEALAANMRLSVLLAGFDTRVVKVVADNRVVYRLELGPFATLAEARRHQHQLQVKAINSTIAHTTG